MTIQASNSITLNPQTSSYYQTSDEAECIEDLEQILDLLNEMGDPPDPTVPQLRALCIDIQQLMIVSDRLAASPNNADQKMAENIDQVLNEPLGDNTLESAALEYPADPNCTAMQECIDYLVETGSWDTLLWMIQDAIDNPPWAPPN